MTYKIMNRRIVKPLYARGVTKTLHRLSLHGRTYCGQEINPQWEVLDLLRGQELNFKECGRCRGENRSFAEIEQRSYVLRKMELAHQGFVDAVELIGFNELTDQEKSVAQPALFDPNYHQNLREEYEEWRRERNRYLEQVKIQKAYVSSLIPSLESTQEGYVYLFHDKSRFRYKIGYSVNPLKRLEQVRSQSPYKNAEIVYAFPTDNMRRDELKLHRVFKHYRKDGEWFELPVEAVELIKLIKGGLTNG